LRLMIQSGELTPCEVELEKVIIKDEIPKYMSGECIAPQMEYIVNH